MRRLVVPALLAGISLAVVIRSVRAHEDKTDPVCGMRVDPDVSPWKADYAGESYYFCMEADRVAFLADPERYAGTLTLTSARERHELVLVVRPRVPTAGAVVKFAVRGYAVGDRMASPPVPSRALAEPEAVVYDMDRTAPPVPERYRLAHLKGDDEDVYGLAKMATKSGEWRVVVEAAFDGARRRGTFTIPIAPVSTATPADQKDAHAGHSMPDAGLSMTAQHEAMKTIGREWYALGVWLRGGPGTAEEARARLTAVETAARDVPKFMLHKFPEAGGEFRGYAETFAKDLTTFRSTLASGDRAAADRAFRQIDAMTCTKCHMKYRWGTAEDLSRFPDLREYPKEGR